MSCCHFTVYPSHVELSIFLPRPQCLSATGITVLPTGQAVPSPPSDAVLRAGAVAWFLGTWKKGIVWCLAQRSMTPLSEMLLSFPGLAFLHWTLYLSVQPAHSGYFSLNLCPVLVAAMIPSPVCLLLTQIPHRVSVVCSLRGPSYSVQKWIGQERRRKYKGLLGFKGLS